MLFMVINYNQYFRILIFAGHFEIITCIGLISFKLSFMQLHEDILYPVNLPKFLLNFKDNFINFIVPRLIAFKQSINNQGQQQQNNVFLTIAFAFIVVYLMQLLVFNLFFKRTSHSNQSNSTNPQLQREFLDLKKQFKSLQISFEEQNKYLNNNSNALQINKVQRNYQKNQIIDKGASKNRDDAEIIKLWQQIAPLYKSSIQNNKKLALYILQTQQEMIKELKKLKKTKTNPSGVRSSTLRSKTTDKKIQGIDKSPSKPLKTVTVPTKKYETDLKSIKINKDVLQPSQSEAKREKETPQPKTIQPKEIANSNQVQKSHPISEKPHQQYVKNQDKFKSQTESVKNQPSQIDQNFSKQKTIASKEEQSGFAEEIDGFKRDYVEKEAETRSQIVTDKQLQNDEEERQEPPVIIAPPKPPMVKKMNPPKTGMRRVPPPPPRR